MSAEHEQDPLVRITRQRPQAVCAALELEPETQELLAGDPAPAPFLSALIQKELFADAVRYLAHALPQADAVAWACDCVPLGRELSDKARAALACAEAWCHEPNEKHCRAAEQAAEASDDVAARFAASAAFWSGESIAPADLPVVPPPAGATGMGVHAALLLAATSAPPAEIPDRFRKFLSHGILIARTPL